MFKSRFLIPISGKISKADKTCPTVVRNLQGLATFEFLRFIRKQVAEFAETNSMTTEDKESLLIAVGEAASNAVLYGSSKKPIKVKMEYIPDYIRITINNSGRRFKPQEKLASYPDLYSEHGRGIMCMKAVMDEVIIESGIFGTKVKLIKKIGNKT